jgi:hypothetical protein
MVHFSLFIKYIPANAKRYYDNVKKKNNETNANIQIEQDKRIKVSHS